MPIGRQNKQNIGNYVKLCFDFSILFVICTAQIGIIFLLCEVNRYRHQCGMYALPPTEEKKTLFLLCLFKEIKIFFIYFEDSQLRKCKANRYKMTLHTMILTLHPQVKKVICQLISNAQTHDPCRGST